MIEARVGELPPPIIPETDALELNVAATMAAVHRDTLLRWGLRYGFAQQRGRKWIVSRIATKAWMADDAPALAAYRRGEVGHPSLQRYMVEAA